MLNADLLFTPYHTERDAVCVIPPAQHSPHPSFTLPIKSKKVIDCTNAASLSTKFIATSVVSHGDGGGWEAEPAADIGSTVLPFPAVC